MKILPWKISPYKKYIITKQKCKYYDFVQVINCIHKLNCDLCLHMHVSGNSMHKSEWILTGNCICMGSYAYILKFPFQVVSWMFSISFYNYSRKRESGIFIDLLVLWLFFENLPSSVNCDFKNWLDQKLFKI